MKVLINLLKFIFITILTICLIALGAITVASSTILDKNYVIQKLEETDFYSGTYKLVESNFEKYIYQSGLDEDVLKSICTEDKVKKEVVQVVVVAIEQLYSELSGEEKLKKAIENATEMLEDRNIFINDLELRMIIESSVNSFNKHKKKM